MLAMEDKDREQRLEIIEKHAYYYPAIDDLGTRFGFFKPVIVDDLPLSSGMVQRAYKEIRKSKFKGTKGTIIDYLCWISMIHYLILLKRMPVTSINEDTLRIIEKWISVLGAAYFSDLNNIFRLFLKRTEYLDEAVDEVGLFNDDKTRREIKKILADKFNYYIETMTNIDLTKS